MSVDEEPQILNLKCYCSSFEPFLLLSLKKKITVLITNTCKRKWQPTPGFLPGDSHGQRSLAGYGPRGCKETRLSD